MDHPQKAAELFLEGYNCAQSITLAFSDVTGLDNQLSAKLAAPFGGGMGRMREVCGAVSGMLMVVGCLYGYQGPEKGDIKKAHYTLVQSLANAFQAELGSIVCRELLKNPPSDPNPTPRTAEFYKERPCVRMVMTAARILDEYIDAHPIQA